MGIPNVHSLDVYASKAYDGGLGRIVLIKCQRLWVIQIIMWTTNVPFFSLSFYSYCMFCSWSSVYNIYFFFFPHVSKVPRVFEVPRMKHPCYPWKVKQRKLHGGLRRSPNHCQTNGNIYSPPRPGPVP